MSLPTYNQYVFPQTPARKNGVTGFIDIRVSRGFFPWNLIDTHPDQVFTLDPLDAVVSGDMMHNRIIKTWSNIKKALVDKDGDMTADARTITFYDPNAYSGVCNGVSLAENLAGAQQSLGWKIFESDPTVLLYQFWWTFNPSPSKGIFSTGIPYVAGDTVVYLGRTFDCILASVFHLPTNTTYFQPAYDIYFHGDVDITQIQKQPFAVHKPRTSQQVEENTTTLSINPAVNRMKNEFVGALIGVTTPVFGNQVGASGSVPSNIPFVATDMVPFGSDFPGKSTGGDCGFQTKSRPFYLGIVPLDKARGGNGNWPVHITGSWFSPALTIDASLIDSYTINGSNNFSCPLGTMYLDGWEDALFGEEIWPFGLWGVTPATCLAKAANAIGLEFNPSTDFTSAHTFYGQRWNNTNLSFDLHTVALSNMALCWNVLFGVSPLNNSGTVSNSTWDNPASLKPQTTINEMLKKFAYMFGCFITTGIDQVTGQPQLKMLSRRTSNGTIPANWKFKKGYPKREPSTNAQNYVAIKNTGADGELRVPAVLDPNAKGISIEIPWRTRRFGGIGVLDGSQPGGYIGANGVYFTSTFYTFTSNYLTLNSKYPMASQNTGTWIIDRAQSNNLNQDAWVFGSFLYEIHTGLSNDFMPPAYNNSSLFNSNHGNTKFEGFVALACCTENSAMQVGTSVNSQSTSEIISMTGLPTGGTFTLTFGGYTTSAIPYNATALQVQTALQALTSIGSGNISCSNGALPFNYIQCNFIGTLAAFPQAAFTFNDSGLTGGSSPHVLVNNTSSGVFTPTVASNRGDTMTANAQLLARELVSNGNVFTVQYKGCTDDTGKQSTIVLNMVDSWTPPGGVLTSMRIIELDIDDLTNLVTAKCIPLANYAALPDLSEVLVNGSNSTSTSSGSNAASSNNELMPVSSVITNPSSSGQNVIIAQTTGVVNLTRKRIASQTADFDEWLDETGATLGKVDKSGNIGFQAGTLNGVLDMTTHLIHNVVDPVVAQDAATKHYVDGAVAGVSIPTDYVRTDNSTTAQNTNQPTANVVNATWKRRASSTADLTDWVTETGVVLASMDYGGQFTANNLTSNINIAAASNITAGTNITAGAKVFSSSTVTGDTATTLTTKDWVVTLKPDSTTGNTIQAQDTSTVPVNVKLFTGSTQHLQNWQDASGGASAYVDSTGNIFGSGAKFTTASSQTVVVTTTGNGNSLVVKSSASSSTNILLIEDGSSNPIFQINAGTKSIIQGSSSNVDTGSALNLSGPIATDTRVLTGTTTLDATYSNVVLDGSGGLFTTTLPQCSTCKGRMYNIVRKSSAGGATTIAAHAGDTIGYGGGSTLTPSYAQSFILISDGGTHWIIG